LKIKSNKFHEVHIYIGSKEYYNGPEFTEDQLIGFIGEKQKEMDFANPVRVNPTIYVWQDYRERGWQISIIDYPRRHKPHKCIDSFALGLAKSLLFYFKQNRISIVFPDEIVMLEADDAKENPKEISCHQS
jgi:hypothetical protein